MSHLEKTIEQGEEMLANAVKFSDTILGLNDEDFIKYYDHFNPQTHELTKKLEEGEGAIKQRYNDYVMKQMNISKESINNPLSKAILDIVTDPKNRNFKPQDNPKEAMQILMKKMMSNMFGSFIPEKEIDKIFDNDPKIKEILDQVK